MTIRQAVLVAGAVALLAVLYVLLKPETSGSIPAANGSASVTSAALPVGRDAKPVEISVDAPAAVRITVRAGESITLDVRSSKDGDVSAHGLSDAEYPVKAGELTRIAVSATMPGTFAIHFHGAGHEHVPLATVDIQPAP